MSHPVYTCCLRFRKSTLYASFLSYTQFAKFLANSFMQIHFVESNFWYCCMSNLYKSSRVPKGIVFYIVNCSILINFRYRIRCTRSTSSADLVLAGKSSFAVAWARAHFIPILLAVLTPSLLSLLEYATLFMKL